MSLQKQEKQYILNNKFSHHTSCRNDLLDDTSRQLLDEYMIKNGGRERQ